MTLEGLSVPVPTIFGAAGELLPGPNGRYVRELCAAGVDHIFVLGTLGEFPLVTDAERDLLVGEVIGSLAGHADAWVGVGAPSTRMAVANATKAEAAGAAAVVAVPPYYMHPTPAAIARYYRALHEAVGIPLFAYNIPGYVGYALAPDELHALAREGVLQGVKDTSGSLASVRTFLDEAPSGFAVLPGDDAVASKAIALGAAGAVMGTANILPKLGVAIVRAARGGDAARADELQRVVDPLVYTTRAGPFPATDKFLCATLRGSEVGYRSPNDALSPDEERSVLAALAPHRERFASFL